MSQQINQKNKSIYRLLFGISGIYFLYLFYGLMQEKIFKKNYDQDDKKDGKFRWPLILVISQSVVSVIIGQFIKKYIYGIHESQIEIKESLSMGFYGIISMFSSNLALSYVSYPIQALFKSSKVLSILLIGLVLGRKHTTTQYLCGFLVTFGICLYNINETNGKKSIQQNDDYFQVLGVSLLLISLIGDGMLSETQQKLIQKREGKSPLNSFDLLVSMNLAMMVITVLIGLATNQIYQCFQFCLKYPQASNDLLKFTLFGVIGQCFIFYTLSLFGPLVVGIITTTRKFFTVILSIIYFGHSINQIQLFSLSIVFLGLFIEFYYSSKSKSKSKQTNTKSKL